MGCVSVSSLEGVYLYMYMYIYICIHSIHAVIIYIVDRATSNSPDFSASVLNHFMEFVLVQKTGAFKQVTDFAHRAPGKIPQTSPNKEKNPSEAVGETSGASSRDMWVSSWKPFFFDTPYSP